MFQTQEIQNEIRYLTNEQERLFNLRIDFDSQLNDVIQKKFSLESEFQLAGDRINTLQLHIKELNSQREELLSRQSHLLEEHQSLHEKLTEKESGLSEILSEINSLKSQMRNLEESKSNYIGILNSPKPEEKYRLDGEYCINGIHLCKNHPPRQVLANQDEIDLYNRRINDARSAMHRIQNQIDTLGDQINLRNDTASSITNDVSILKEQIQRCSDEMRQVQIKLGQSQNEIQQYQIELSEAGNKINQIDSELLTAKSLEANIRADILQSESQLRQIENNIEHLRIRLSILQQNMPSISSDSNSTNFFHSENQFPTYSNEEQMLEQIAAAELQKERARREEEALLERIARDELAREQALLEQIAREELAKEQGLSNSTSISDQISAGASNFLQALESTKESIRDNVSAVSNAAGSLYPYPGTLLMDAMFQRVDEKFFDKPASDTGNLILDAGSAAQQRMSNTK